MYEHLILPAFSRSRSSDFLPPLCSVFAPLTCTHRGVKCCVVVELKAMLKGRAKSSMSPSRDAASDTLELPSTLVECNRRMFEHQDGCDMTIIAKGPGDATETKIGAHRYVLCSRSPFFHKALQWGSKAPADKKLKEHDIPTDVLREILRSVSRMQCYSGTKKKRKLECK